MFEIITGRKPYMISGDIMVESITIMCGYIIINNPTISSGHHSHPEPSHRKEIEGESTRGQKHWRADSSPALFHG